MTRNLFVELLQEAGCNVQGQATFSTEPILFRRNLSLRIRGDPRSQELLEEFFESLNNYMTDTQQFRQCLLPAKFSGETSTTYRANTSESLIKTLLAIDILQPKLMTYLLERLPEFFDELENDASSSCTARLILNQIRWLEYIVEPQELTSKLIEIIEATPTVLQHEIIVSLPDIISDSEHKPIVVFLKELMSENAELTVPILDTLSNLAMHSEISDEFRQTILDRLVSAELDELPVLVKFLLQTVNTSYIDEVIYGIREKLDFQSLGGSTARQDTSSKNAPEALILESIKLGLQFHKFVCDAWVKSITALETEPAHKVIDVLVLIILHSMTSMKKKAEQIFRKKVISGLITPDLVQDTILHHANGLSAYWNTILSLTESLLRSCKQNSAVASCSRSLYICTFKASDAYLRQEIVGSLVTHIGSGSPEEIEIALNVLYDLAEDNVNSMAVYGVFIKGILDYLDNLTLPQIRTLFAIFSILALGAENGSDYGNTSLWSEIQIVIRKQLSNPREKYKNMGIMGCLAGVKVLGNPKFTTENESGQGSSVQRSRQGEYSAEDALRHPMLQQAVGLLEMILRNCSSIPRCMALLYDELAYMIANEDLDERLQLWIKENMTSSFTDTYVEDREEAIQIVQAAERNAEISIKPSITLHLDGDDGPIVLKLYSLFSGVNDVKRKLLASPLCAMFNLLQACEKKLNNGSLEDIDALLGCGLVLYSDDNPREFRAGEQQDVCDLLFYAINWLRELLNAFSLGTDQDMRYKLTMRLKHILSLEAKLDNVLKHMSRYVPLELQQMSPFLADTRNLSIQNPSTDEGNSEGDVKTNVHESAKGTAVASISDLRLYMRALNLDVLSILRPATETEDENPDSGKLNYDDIAYVLQDLNNKLDLKIVPASTSLFGRKKAVNEHKNAHTIALLARQSTGEFLQQILQYLPNILEILEKAYEDMQVQDTQGGRIPQSAEGLVRCVGLIFEIIQKIVSWPAFKNQGNNLILSILIGTIANRISPDGSQTQPFGKLLQDAFQYMYRYSDMMPTATTAVMHFKILVRLRSFSNDPESLRKNTQLVAARIISTDWFDWRNIKKEIPYLLEQSIELHDNPLQTLHDYVNNILPLYETEDRLEDHPLLRSDTVLYYYQAMMNQAIKAIGVLKETDDDNADVVLSKTGKIVNIFERLTSYIKSKDQRSLFGVLLKNGRSFVDQFSKHSIPYFNKVFKTHKDVIVSIFKDFQTSTRMLQIICSHVKVIKDTQLAAYVPPLKKAMETVIFDVKMLLSQNNAPSDAFFLGALKHRDIRGQEVSSQIPKEYPSDSEAEEQDELDSVSTTASKTRSSASSKTSRKKSSRKNDTRGEMAIRTGSDYQNQEEEEEEDELTLEAAEEDDAEEQEVEEEEEEDESMQTILDSDDDQPIRLKRPATDGSFLRICDEDEEEAEEEERGEEEEDQRAPPPKSIEVPKPKRRRLGLGRPSIPKSAKVFNLTNQDDSS